MVLPERASEAYIEALDEITAIAGADGTWSKFTVDDVLWEHIAKALQVSPEEDLLVYGMDVSCADLTFGGLTFFSDEVSVENEYSSGLADFPSSNQMFARLETTAIDAQSAIHRAASILDERLMILNALCSFGSPSFIRVSRVNHIDRTYSVHRIGKSADSMG